ncbi:RNA-directed DNA polymerase, eukaryota, reverse transcriptase zinc-binding domain protein [Tanacetum coccineum]
MEVFTLMLRRQVSKEVKFKYNWGCKNLGILNLCFADDLMLFCHGDMVSASVLRRALDEFCLSSGLKPNMAKSTVYFGNVCEDVKNNIMIAMPFREGSFPIRYMDKIFKEFLWKTDGKRNIRYSVAWKEVCMQKSEGGLGLKSINVWNVVLMAKHLWNAITSKESIWVKWVNSHYIMDNSIWAVDPSHHSSWIWKQILSSRDKIRSFVKLKISNGSNYYFWFDNWYKDGPLCKLINYSALMKDMFILKTKVVDLVLDGEWRWPGDWNFIFKELLDIPSPSLIDNHEDRVFWINKKGKLKTQDRISRWLNIQVMSCPFCKMCKESHSHLFYSCNIAKRLWERLKGMAKLEHVSNSRAQVISSIVNIPAKNSIWSVIQSLVLGASVYYIWQERNICLFREEGRSKDEIFKIMVEFVRLRIMSLKLKVTPDVIMASKLWNF